MKICLCCAREGCWVMLLVQPQYRPESEWDCPDRVPYVYPPRDFADIMTNPESEDSNAD